MDTRTAHVLNDLNQRFYEACAPSFSDTRSAAWQGWRGCLDAACGNLEGRPNGRSGAVDGEGEALRVLDVACGNLRFESFLADELGDHPFAVCAVDTCEFLARDGAEAFGLPVQFEGPGGRSVSAASLKPGDIRFRTCDIVAQILDGGQLGFADFDAAVCFGFFHHVPGQQARIDLLDKLIASVRPGGVVAISLWRFMDDERLARKALEASVQARIDMAGTVDFDALEAGDYFLGWQDMRGVYRYAHSFSDGDVDELVDAASNRAQLLARFRADGRTNDLNEYLVFRAV